MPNEGSKRVDDVAGNVYQAVEVGSDGQCKHRLDIPAREVQRGRA